MDFESFREQLVVWGVTPNVLMFVGIVSVITLFFSFRIVIKWYLGVQFMQEELRTIKKQLSDIQLLISMNNSQQTLISESLEEPSKLKSEPAKNESFRLTNH